MVPVIANRAAVNEMADDVFVGALLVMAFLLGCEHPFGSLHGVVGADQGVLYIAKLISDYHRKGEFSDGVFSIEANKRIAFTLRDSRVERPA